MGAVSMMQILLALKLLAMGLRNLSRIWIWERLVLARCILYDIPSLSFVLFFVFCSSLVIVSTIGSVLVHFGGLFLFLHLLFSYFTLSAPPRSDVRELLHAVSALFIYSSSSSLSPLSSGLVPSPISSNKDLSLPTESRVYDISFF